MHTCPWCTTSYVNWQSQCKQCGGPLAPLPGMSLGSPPPAAPRVLPPQYVFRLRWSRNIATLVGGGFFLVGTLLFLPMAIAGTWAALLPAFFMLGGFSMFRYGWRHASGILRAFRDGRAVEGRIASVSWDTTQRINDQHPWKLVYHFPVGEQMCEGSITTFDSTVGSRMSGQPLWVLYNEADTSQSTIYPPLV